MYASPYRLHAAELRRQGIMAEVARERLADEAAQGPRLGAAVQDSLRLKRASLGSAVVRRLLVSIGQIRLPAAASAGAGGDR
jgi:hypothetical protein